MQNLSSEHIILKFYCNYCISIHSTCHWKMLRVPHFLHECRRLPTPVLDLSNINSEHYYWVTSDRVNIVVEINNCDAGWAVSIWNLSFHYYCLLPCTVSTVTFCGSEIYGTQCYVGLEWSNEVRCLCKFAERMNLWLCPMESQQCAI